MVRLAFIVMTFLRCGGTRAEFAITAVRNDNDTPAKEGLQGAQLARRVEKPRVAARLDPSRWLPIHGPLK
jgi:hypothetical protein